MRQSPACFLSALFGLTLLAAVSAQPPSPVTTDSRVTALPPLPAPPVDMLRKLLALSPEEREKMLADRNPEQRRFVQLKLAEFDCLTMAEREARLRALQSRYYFSPLMRMKPSARATALARVPAAERALVEQK